MYLFINHPNKKLNDGYKYMSTTELTINHSIVSDGILEKNDDVLVYDERSYTFHDSVSKSICTLYTRLNNNVQEKIIDIHELKYIEPNINPYKSNKYNWKKISESLVIDYDKFNPNYCILRRINDNSYIVILVNNSEIHNTEYVETIRIYGFDINNGWNRINNNLEGKIAFVSNNAEDLLSYKSNKLIFYKLSDFKFDSINIKKISEVDITSTLPEYTDLARLVPSYVFMNGNNVLYGMGIPTEGRHLMTEIKMFKYDNGVISNEDNVRLIQRNMTTINNTATGLGMNPSSTRFTFINLSLFFIEEINKYVPRYAVSVYDKKTDGTWFEFGTLLGSTIDPTFIEANPSLGIDVRTTRAVTALNTAEYKNINISLNDDGVYVCMWVPFIKYDEDVVVVKPFYENVSSFVRVDSIKANEFFDETTTTQT